MEYPDILAMPLKMSLAMVQLPIDRADVGMGKILISAEPGRKPKDLC